MFENYITGYCRIRKNEVILNDKIDYVHENFVNFADFIKAVYKVNEIKYPKFFKMDNLCKLAFVTADLLLKDSSIKEGYEPGSIGLILENSSSSLATDIEFNETIKDRENYYPSPSVFVYTLPNIMLGEIAIRNKIMGENGCFIFKQFDSSFIFDYVSDLMNSEKIDCCITGWVEFGLDSYDSFIVFIEKSDKTMEKKYIFNIENLEKLYK